MRNEVLTELKTRIDALEQIAKPMDIATGMSGSFLSFNMYIDSSTAMTEDEFSGCVYDDWLREQHEILYKKVNKSIQ